MILCLNQITGKWHHDNTRITDYRWQIKVLKGRPISSGQFWDYSWHLFWEVGAQFIMESSPSHSAVWSFCNRALVPARVRTCDYSGRGGEKVQWGKWKQKASSGRHAEPELRTAPSGAAPRKTPCVTLLPTARILVPASGHTNTRSCTRANTRALPECALLLYAVHEQLLCNHTHWAALWFRFSAETIEAGKTRHISYVTEKW